MKKLFFTLIIVVVAISISTRSYAQQNAASGVAVLSIALKQPVETAKLLIPAASPDSVKQASFNCDVYLSIVALLQQQLQHASPSQKADIIRAIKKARADYDRCKQLSTVISTNITNIKLTAQ